MRPDPPGGPGPSALGLVLALVSFLLPSVELWALPLDGQPWHELESASFTLVTGAGLEQSLELLAELEALRAVLAETTYLEVASPVPTRIYIFPNDRAFLPYKHLYHGAPAAMSGAFYPRDDLDIITLHGALKAEARLTVLHEYVHVVLRNNLPGLPLWLEEGLAELFATLESDGEGLRVGRPVPWHIRALSKGADLPLAELISIGPDSARYQRFEDQALFYARSWELTHYLFAGNATRRHQALRFIALGRRGVEPRAAFVRAFGSPPEVLEKELADYRKGGFEPRRLTAPTEAVENATRPRIRRLDHAMLLVRLGDVLISQGDRSADAIFHFEQALERMKNPTTGAGRLRVGPRRDGTMPEEPEDGSLRRAAAPPEPEAVSAALRGLGLVAERSGDLARARAHYRKALTFDRTSALGHYRLASSLLWLGRAAGAEKSKEARQHLEASIALDPNFAPAWDALARALRPAGDGDSAESAVKDAASEGLARALASGSVSVRDEAAVRLAVLYNRDGRAEQVRRVAAWIDDADSEMGNKQASKLRLASVLAHLRWQAGSGPVPDYDLLRPSPPVSAESAEESAEGPISSEGTQGVRRQQLEASVSSGGIDLPQ